MPVWQTQPPPRQGGPLSTWGRGCASCFPEFRKAFDAISHSILLEKVAAHGRGTLWVQSWLWGWAQRVMESGVTSSWQPWVPGFPMSQYWGLFCLIYVSAIWKRGSGTIYQFVDYTNLAGVLVCFRKVLQGTGWIDGLRAKVWNQWDRVPCPTLGDTETLSKAPGLGQCGWNAAWWKRTWGWWSTRAEQVCTQLSKSQWHPGLYQE